MYRRTISRSTPRFLIAGLALFLAGVSAAATFTVDSTIDASDAIPGNGICSDGAGHCTLRAAIQEANSASAASTNVINVPPGTYVTTSILLVNKVDAAKDLSIIGTGPAGGVIVDASGGNAHGVFIVAGGGLTSMTNLTIQNGSTSTGGAVTVGDANLDIALCVIRDNHASIDGGGVYLNHNNAALKIDRSTVSHNIAAGNAGGIDIRFGTANISNSAIINNQAGASMFDGGGIVNAATLAISNSTVSGNSAKYGGGISSSDNTGTASSTITNVTISGNSAQQQLNSLAGLVTVQSSIIANPIGGTNCLGTINSLGHNLESAATCSFIAMGDINNSDPLLAQLASNGSPILTHALLPGSPALDHGINPLGFKTDQRGTGFPRVVGADIDIGAFEGVQVDKVFVNGFEIPAPGN